MRRLQRQRDERAEAQLRRDRLPVLERWIREEIEHLDGATFARRLTTRTKAEPHAHLAEKARVALGPVVHGGEAHQLRAFVDEIDARERGADERAHLVESELIDVFGTLRGEERVRD